MNDTFETLMGQIEKLGHFESLVQLPERKEPWPAKWVARATVNGHGTNAQGQTHIEALKDLLKKLLLK